MALTKLEVVKEFRFEASHVLPKHPGKCSRLHGHSWVMRVGVRGPIDPRTGFVVDYADLKALVTPLIDLLDHHYLGCGSFYTASGDMIAARLGESFYPSSENLVLWVRDQLINEIHTLPQRIAEGPYEQLELSLVEIEETCTSRATWRPQHA